MNHFQTPVIKESHKSKKFSIQQKLLTLCKTADLCCFNLGLLLLAQWCGSQKLAALQAMERSNHLETLLKAPSPEHTQYFVQTFRSLWNAQICTN